MTLAKPRFFCHSFFYKICQIWSGYFTLHHHHHLQKNPFGAVAALCRFLPDCIWAFTSLDFSTVLYYTDQDRQPCNQPRAWRTRSQCSCSPVTGWPVLSPGTGFHFRHLRLAGLWCRYSDLPPQWNRLWSGSINILFSVTSIRIVGST
jgi:hypothetical protein